MAMQDEKSAPPRPSDVERDGDEETHSSIILRALNDVLFEFLSLQETVQLLSTCRSLRGDVPLASHLLQTHPATKHYHSGCASDWCSLLPENEFFDGHAWILCDLSNAEDHDREKEAEDEEQLSTDCDGIGITSISKTQQKKRKPRARQQRHPFAVQYLSVAGFVQHRLAKWCFSSVSLHSRVVNRDYWRRVHDMRFVCRPLIVPLHSHFRPNGATCDEDRWSEEAVARALNEVHPGFGDSFILNVEQKEASPELRESNALLSYHWDAITVDPKTGAACCALCEWRTRVIREYTERRPAMLSLGTKEVQHLHVEEDAILRQILGNGDVDSGQLPEWMVTSDWPLGMEQKQQLARNLYCALCRYHRRQCEVFYQPLKALFATQNLRFVNVVSVDWIEAQDGFAYYSSVPTQLLAGISPSGFLVGLYRMVAGVY